MHLDKPGHDAATRQQGAHWMQEAAGQDHPVALMHLAAAAFAAGDEAEGVDRTRRAAEAGDAAAQYTLGLFHLNGEGVPADASAAVPWFTRAANQGHPRAQEQLAGAYWNGRGVARDEDEACFWLLLAAAELEKARAFLETAGEWIGPERMAAARRRADAWTPAVERTIAVQH